ncbi:MULTISPECIES: cytochrome c [unclassified Roseitalea]|uniref:c-type cytochrome n=1 Tax=unclassified Roseitalea TaxID=2639107 RepID=UPI00273F3746|nr:MULTISPECIES: cytochrome c [unclassified Roseitalea]
MLRAIVVVFTVIAVVGAGFWLLTRPMRLDQQTLAAMQAHEADLSNGQTLFWAGGCASCHADADAEGEDRRILSGGAALDTVYGTFGMPNISPHPDDGIGRWSLADFANAMLRGISPEGRHYYPAFPYTSYARMTPGDVADLWAYLKTLPAVESDVTARTELGFPFNIRRGLGLWKRAYLDAGPVIGAAELGEDAMLLRGRYLVEGPGHCGECHTPRDFAGAMRNERWLAGAPNPEGDGRIPNITAHEDGVGDWTEDDIAFGLESGFTPEFDSMGSTMAAVVKNFANVPAADRAAIAAYLKAIPAMPDAR